ncbi:palmitoyl-protein hydrolase [Balamuthia mandrillaris]
MQSRRDKETVVIEPTETHTATVIFLHGLGDTGMGWYDPMKQLSAENPHIKFILPTAPRRPVTINFGSVMPAWYDITDLGASREEQKCEGIHDAKATVERLIKAEVEEHGIPHHRIIIGGFSQGAAVSLFTGFSLPSTLAGVIALSGYLALKDEFLANLTEAGRLAPLLMCHGESDPLIRLSWAELSFQAIQSIAGVKKATFKKYRGLAHSLSLQELKDVAAFVRECLPKEEKEKEEEKKGGGSEGEDDTSTHRL